jgi:hypothetical protein
MKPIYRVVKHTQYKEFEVAKEYFTIQKQVRVLFWKKWRTIDKEVNTLYIGGTYRIDITFDTESEAVFAIKKLEMGAISQGWTKEVTSVLDFNKKGGKE